MTNYKQLKCVYTDAIITDFLDLYREKFSKV